MFLKPGCGRMKRIFTVLLAFLELILCMVPLAAEEEEVLDENGLPIIENCTGAYLYNFENDQILFAKGETERIYPTATAKIMAGIVSIEQLGNNLTQSVLITEEMLKASGGIKMGLTAGEIVTVEQLLYAALVNNANDAVIALAYTAAGSVEDFVALMNEKATQLGAYDTHYTNPMGLHSDSMVTTIADTAIIARHAYTIPLFMEIVSTPKYVMEATNQSDYRNLYNRNSLISKFYNSGYFYKRAIGMNAGSTSQGGYCICAVAEDPASGLTYLAIVMGGKEVEGEIYSYANAIRLFDWAFESFTYIEVLRQDKIVCELPVNLSSALDYVTLVPETSITVYLPTSTIVSEDIRYSYNTYEDSLNAPISAGQTAGTITVLMGDRILGSCNLITTSSVTRSEFLYFLARIREFSKGRFFKATLISIIVFSIAYVFIKAGWREHRMRKRSRNINNRPY
ncbi:MAG: D-alanyl-D-alanine carboxypeptidase [Clostridia bacterium]|nr:D-alanyl-D-alanine carboxypeptidase [Clostridia bacterium]